MKRFVMVIFVLINIGLLSACTTNSSFDCPNKAGVNCRSLDQINRMVDNGQIHGRTQMDVREETKTNLVDGAEFQSFPTAPPFIPGQPIRYGETVQRIWIAPYEDTDGNYHQDSLIYAIMKGGHWIGKPVKTVRSF
jgi:conjugal transfer pilus assembly protein TraV